MTSGSDFLIGPTSDREAWLTGIRSVGVLSSQGVESNAFRGSVRGSCLWGITTLETTFASLSVCRFERMHRDPRLECSDYYNAVFQIFGRSTLIQKDRVMTLAVGDIGFVDVARPVSLISCDPSCRWLSLSLPRRALVSHVGREPHGGMHCHGATPASRRLFRLVSDALGEGDTSAGAADAFMRLAVYDLIGALFADSDLPSGTSHTDKLFTRICRIATNHFSNPELSLRDVAGEAGISLRYLQKLFTARGTTYSRFIQSLRLDHAAQLLNRQNLLDSGQPLTEIAYACGFRDYAHFSRTFHLRFGCTPSAASEGRLSAPG
ncbi:helix-turn-helix domain-containing protein [Bradyrhizobium sp. 1(2017)]|uniref:helix-turn-helix domain-containing protein n=1 Tax=Bradyrhizobium sp. 1(2017) TaxID=1404888 RepID=UPI00140ECBE4|nr:helix-turn-helix domain-containing protein [Bradyrhizobium sp. 1(2017)]QIO34859.1 helix-turn-helix domain-containing protein [Bradyrhizobium sp. 1(2017)]